MGLIYLFVCLRYELLVYLSARRITEQAIIDFVGILERSLCERNQLIIRFLDYVR